MGYAIYKVTNLSNGKIYIGQTCQSLQQRMREHKSKRTSPLYFDIQKYGIEQFKIETIDYAETKENAKALEEQWTLDTKSYIDAIGYNKAIATKRYSVVNGFYGKHHTDESISENRLNQPHRKSVIDFDTGIVYSSIRECAKALNITKTYVSNVCNGKIKKHNKGNFAFV